jgi:hypothetical protein
VERKGSGSQTHPTLEKSIQHVYVQIGLGKKVKFIEKPTYV